MPGKSSKFLSLTLYTNNNLNPHVFSICHKYRGCKGYNEKLTLKWKFSQSVFPSFTFSDQPGKDQKHFQCSESNNFSFTKKIWNILDYFFFPLETFLQFFCKMLDNIYSFLTDPETWARSLLVSSSWQPLPS